ncbi:PepSY domain-containing protein [Pararhodobacter sp.]|uniref:PepSY domain-containing protein n=1 Tax=Pararhodobacter sp. TaxID=2127056 RepID=UPI002AFFDB14|nr:PepSY domain-containing protein [Pararhodobacter sp.]
MKRAFAPFLLAAALALPASAQTQPAGVMDPETLQAQFQTSGWESVEMQSNEHSIEIEARRGAMEIEVVYDRATGMVRDLDIENIDGRPITIPGLTLTSAS